MENNFNNLEIETKEERKNLESPKKLNIYISSSKNEFINNESDIGNIKISKNSPFKKIQNEESKEPENEEYLNENIKSKYMCNKFNTIDNNNIGRTSLKNKTSLQEKLKKIFMNRDKLKFQYTKQDIPDNLKYNSDDSESSEISGLRKSKISKKNNSNNTNKNRKSQKSSETQKSDLKGEAPLPIQINSPTPFDENEKNNHEENNNLFNSKKNKKNEGNQKIISQNEEEKAKSNEKKEIFKCEKGPFRYCNKLNNNEEEKEQDRNDVIKRESEKKNILLNMFEKRNKNDEINETAEKKNFGDKNESKKDIEKDNKKEDEDEKKNRKLNLLKLLLNKKESNTIEYSDNENEENPKRKLDIEKEKRRRKII